MADEEAVLKRVMPNSPEAEQSVIGAMLMDRDAILVATEVLAQEDFYHEQYGVIFSCMADLCRAGEPSDPVTLQNKLKEQDVPPEVSSLSFLQDLMDQVPTSANIRYYANIVRDDAIKRRLIRTMESLQNDCYAGKESADELMNRTEHDIFELLSRRVSGTFTPIREIVLSALERIEAASKQLGHVTGIPTGFYELDEATAGLQPSDLILIAARPSMGKSALMMNLAEYAAIHERKTTAIFSLEMSKEQLVNRLFAMESHVNAQAIRTGSLNDAEWEQLAESAGVIAESNLIIDDTPGIGVPEIRSKCRKYKLENDLQLVMIDYLQLMSGSGHAESRQQEVSEISRSLKALARELEVPVVALSQLSRAPEQRPNHRPMMSDLRESGAIEQDADLVMFIYRDDYYHEDTEDRGIAELIIGKQRNGPTETVKLAWLPEYSRFANLQH